MLLLLLLLLRILVPAPITAPILPAIGPVIPTAFCTTTWWWLRRRRLCTSVVTHVFIAPSPMIIHSRPGISPVVTHPIVTSIIIGVVRARVTFIAEDGTVLGDSSRDVDSLAAMDNHLHRNKAVAKALLDRVQQSERERKEHREPPPRAISPEQRAQIRSLRKATDRDRWLAGMRRFQSALFPDGPLPGDAIAPKL